MKSGFVSFHNSTSLADSFTADQIVGNRFKVLKDVTAFVSYPGNSETEQWSQGTYTPVVNSWVTREDGVYWMFGEMTPYRYVKHDKEAFKIVPVTGGDVVDLKFHSKSGKADWFLNIKQEPCRKKIMQKIGNLSPPVHEIYSLRLKFPL